MSRQRSMPRALGVTFALVTVAAAAISSSASCSDPAVPTGSPHKCARDLDCGNHQYCTEALVCRSDCFSDSDCIGPFLDSQCNARGRCLDSADAIAPPPPPDDVGPDAAATDAKADGASDGYDAIVDPEIGP